MTDIKRSIPKPRKYNPKPNKVCVGQFLTMLYKDMHKVLKESDLTDEQRGSAAWAMNMIIYETTTQWCRDPWCMAAAKQMNEHFKKKEQQDGENK